MAKPSSKINWTVGNSNPSLNVVEPTEAKKTFGFFFKEKIAYNMFNWLLKNINDWINYFETRTDGVITEFAESVDAATDLQLANVLKNNIRTRYFKISSLASNATSTVNHNINTAFKNLELEFYYLSSGELIKLEDYTKLYVYFSTANNKNSFIIKNNSSSTITNLIVIINIKEKSVFQSLNLTNFNPSKVQVSNGVFLSSTMYSICYSPTVDRYIAAGTGSASCFVSQNKYLFDSVQTNVNFTIKRVKWVPFLNKFVAVGLGAVSAPTMYTSTNGSSWTQLGSSYNNNVVDFDVSPTLNIGVGVVSANTNQNIVRYDFSNNTTTLINTGVTQYLNSVIWVHELGLFIAGGVGGTILTSPDGTTWTQRTAPNQAYVGFAWSPILKKIIGITTSGVQADSLVTSTDGITWSAVALPIAVGEGTNVYWSEKLGVFLALFRFSGTTKPNVFYSEDGVTWSYSNFKQDTFDLFNATWDYKNNCITFSGDYGTIYSSNNIFQAAQSDNYGLVRGGRVPSSLGATTDNYAGFIGSSGIQTSSGAIAWVSAIYNVGGNLGVTVPKGVCLVRAKALYTVGTDSAITEYLLCVSNSNAANTNGVDVFFQERPASHTPSGTTRAWASPWQIIRQTSDTTWYPKARITGTRGTGTIALDIEWICIG